MSQIVNGRELAEMVGISYFTILRMAREGVIPCLRFGHRTVRFDVEDVKRVLRKRSKSAGAAPAGK